MHWRLVIAIGLAYIRSSHTNCILTSVPKIADKRKVLGGRGTVVLYASGTSAGQYFYRELIKGTKNYKTRRIEGVSNMDEAEIAATEVAFELNKEPDLSIVFDKSSKSSQSRHQRDYRTGQVVDRRPRKQRIEDAIDAWLAKEQERVDAGLISQGYLNARRNGLKNHLLSYLDHKLIIYTNEIDLNTFTDYPVWRAQTTPIARRQEIKWIKEWCLRYLVKNKYIDTDLVLDKAFLPNVLVKQTDLMKNPAINAEDWKVIIDFVRDDWRLRPLNQENKGAWFFRNMFWHFILFMKNTGMSPEEILKMKWRQVEIVDVGRINSKGVRVNWEVAYIRTIRSKTQQAREIPSNQARELRRWKKFLDEFISDKDLAVNITKETLVFGQPHFGWNSFSYKHIGETWREIRREIGERLQGHRFSPHPYTVYSLRSTFAEDHLLKGTPVLEVAEMMGHSVVETQKTYARLNLRKKGREITMPELGRRIRGEGEIINILE